MAIDLSQIKNRLNKLQSTQNRSNDQWKPTPGKHQIRIVPYKFNKENPFIELYFHYNVNKKTYISPQSFGRPDPIMEFAEKLKRMGDKEDWKAARRMEAKLRTFVPVIVRGEEDQGVRFWGFGKTVYQEILGYIADPDYGDISDPRTGRDLTVEYTSAEDGGTQFPVTTIRVKPKETPLTTDKKQFTDWMDGQTEITDSYTELSYDELKTVLNGWLNPDAEEEEEEEDTSTPSKESTSQKTLSNNSDDDAPFDMDDNGLDRLDELADTKENTEKKKVKVDDVATAFDDLFNS